MIPDILDAKCCTVQNFCTDDTFFDENSRKYFPRQAYDYHLLYRRRYTGVIPGLYVTRASLYRCYTGVTGWSKKKCTQMVFGPTWLFSLY